MTPRFARPCLANDAIGKCVVERKIEMRRKVHGYWYAVEIPTRERVAGAENRIKIVSVI